MNKKKFLSLLLVLVLACSMVFGLTACNKPVVEPDYATFYYQSDVTVAPVLQKIYINDFKKDASISEVLLSTDAKYGFDADITIGSWGPMLNAIKGKGITPSKVQYISVFTNIEPEKIDEYTQIVDINNIKFYSSPVGIGEIKLTKDTKYLFQVVDNSYLLDTKGIVNLDKCFALDKTQPWLSSITAPALTDKNIYFIRANELIMTDLEGNIVKTQKLKGSTYNGMSSPIICDSKIICPVREHVQAFNLDLTPAWDYTNVGGGFFKSNIVYDNKTNSIFAGFFTDYGSTAKFVSIDASTGKENWSLDLFNGYDFGGVAVIEDYVVVKNVTQDNKYSVVVYNCSTGTKVSEKEIRGIVDSQIVYDSTTNSIYFTVSERDSNNIGIRTASYLEKISIDAKSGVLGNIQEMQTKYSRSVGVPSVNNGRIYITSNNADYKNPQACMEVVDASTMKSIYSVETGVACEGKQVVKNVKNTYRDETFVFFTLNNNEGGLYYIVDSSNSTSAVVKTLYASENKNKSMSDVVLGSNGTMYYKNDSSSIFGVKLNL